MTDPFEEAVRAAGRGLASPDPAPSYHGSWKRGRRRRIAKRSGIAVVGALALVVAFGTDLGRFSNGGSTIESDDIAIESDAIPAQPLATTEPVITDDAATTVPDLEIEVATPNTAPNSGSADSASPDSASSDTPSPDTQSSEAESPEPEGATNGTSATDAPVPTAVPPTPVPTIAVPATPEPTPTVPAAPVPTVAATPEPTTSIDPSSEASPDAPSDGSSDPGATEPADSATLTEPNVPDDSSDPAGAGQTGPVDEAAQGDRTGDPALGATLPPASPSTANRIGLPADARIAPDAADAVDPKCDVDGDAVPDTVCELLPAYRCSGSDDVRVGYQAVDVDGDGVVDTCEPILETTCDTTGDGVGDVVCRIRP